MSDEEKLFENRSRKTDWFYFSGKCSWAKLITPDPDFKKWSLKLHLDQPSLDLFKRLKQPDGNVAGILNEIKEDDDGPYVTLGRPTEKWGKPLPPPIVLGNDDKGLPMGTMIGNGSDVTCKVECYKFTNKFSKAKGRAIRLVAVRVDNLVPYSPKSMDEFEAKIYEGMSERPGPQPYKPF